MINRLLVAAALTLTVSPTVLAEGAPKPEAGVTSTTTRAPVVAVPSDRVCMITNKLFDSPQIPIAVDGKTYYGCCDMCKERLGSDAKARQAVDPVTKAQIDKAKAVIGADAKGNIVYFESLETLNKYNAGA